MSDWMAKNALVCWLPTPEPWKTESVLISDLDLPFNLEPARELGMAVVHHTEPAQTIAELRDVLGVALPA